MPLSDLVTQGAISGVKFGSGSVFQDRWVWAEGTYLPGVGPMSAFRGPSLADVLSEEWLSNVCFQEVLH